MASKKIKGITIEIGGSTTKLDKAINESTKKSKSLQAELKEVNKLLKFDPKNTELLAQKQKLIKEAIANTADQLDILKDAEKQVQQQFERGEVSEEKYRALQREIASTESYLKSLEAQAKESNTALEKAGEAARKIGEKSEALGQKLLPVTVSITAVGAGAVKSFNDLDSGYDTIITKTGATGDALDDLQGSMDSVFTSLPTEAETAGIAIGDVNTRLGLTGKELEDTSAKFIKFAEVNDTDVSTAIASVTRAMGDAGMEASEVGDFLDVLTKASQASGIAIDKLTENVTKYGAPMRALGFDTKSSIAIFSSWEKAGVNTEIAFSGMKKAISNWSSAGKDSREEFKKTLEEIKNCPDIATATTKAIEVFGAKAGPDLADAIQGGRFEYENFLQILGSSDGTLESTYEGILDPADKAKVALNNLKLAGADLAENGMNMLAPMLDKVTNKIKTFTNWFKSLSDKQKDMIIKIALVVAAIGPALIVFGKLSQGVGTICKGVSKLSGLLGSGGGLSGALTALTGPIGIVMGVIAALAAGLFYLYNTNEGFRTKVQELVATIQEKFASLQETLQPALELLKQAFSDLMNALQPVFEFIMNFIVAVVMGVMEAAEPLVSAITNIVDFITNIVNAFVALLSGDFDGFFQYISNALQNVCDFVTNIVSAIVNFIVGFFQQFGVNVKQIFSDIWSGICSVFQNCGQWFSDRFTEAYNFVTSIFSGIGAWFSQRWSDITNVFSGAASWFSGIFSNAWQAVKNVFSGWGSFFSGLWSTISSTFTNLGTNIASAISGAVKSGINGVITMIENTVNGAIKIINGAINLINKIPGVSIGNVKNLELPRLAKGGILTNGRAIVAEAGPEIIEMVNGKTIVTPLSGSARNTSLERNLGGKQSGKTEIIMKIENFYNNRQQDIRELTQEILEIAQEIKERDEEVYA